MPTELLVLAAVDDSPVARLVVAEAERLAGLMHGRLRVVHVADAPDSSTFWLADLQDEGMRIERRTGGAPWVVLAREAHACAARVLVVGSHGRSGFQPLAPGATTRKLLVSAPCPVVVVGARLRQTPAHAGVASHQLPGGVA
ncbi:MAG TPA: universal stress protein [Gemmatimonadales bacterium]|nr:universal stress protein [Gemmatimonadales bacterium]